MSHLLHRIVETVFPTRLGTGFRWLTLGFWASSVGDGLLLAAGPLLVASQTSEPILVAAAAAAQTAPWLLFGLLAGALADRLDRRVLILVVDAVRVCVLAGLCAVILTDHVDIGLVLVALFAHATAEVFADTTAGTLTPMLVDKADLGVANSRIMAGHVTANQLVGPAAGAVLFSAGVALPFLVQAVCLAVAIVLIARIATPPLPVAAQPGSAGRASLRTDISQGVRWLAGNGPVRTLALVIVVFNITWAAPWSVLVLWAQERVGLDALGFGLLASVSALGGLVATVAYGRIERRVPLATLMRTVLGCEVVFHLAMAVTTSSYLAYGLMFFFGAYAFMWGTLSNAVRQRAVRAEFQGRVGSVYLLCVMGGMLAGSALGGVIAGRWGVNAPWWFAFTGSALTLALVWRALAAIAHADEEATAQVH